MFRKLVLCLSLGSCVLPVAAQAQTGLYPLGSFDNVGIDSIDRGSLNVHFAIPVVNKAGRGTGFSYQLVYDSLVWSPANAAGVATWTPSPGFGLRGELNDGLEGYISYFQRTLKCYPPGGGSFYWDYVDQNYVYHDQFGVSHAFAYTYNDCTGTTTGSGAAKDGSGFSFDGNMVTSPDGKKINAPFNSQTSSGSVTDANGNYITNHGDGTFTDTLGTTALTITGSGTASSPRLFKYNTRTGTATVTVAYKTYTVRTSFGCTATEFNLSQDLVDTITLADGSVYQFGYEPTPNYSPDVTGRLAKLTLPQGGIIQYQYTGANNGIVCADGTPAGLTRTGGVNRTYVRSSITAASSHTDITDGLNNVSGYDFVMAGTPESFYETNRTVHQGSTTVLLSRQTCYNNNSTRPCTTTAIALPVTQIDTYETLNGIQQRGSTLTYNTFGLLTSKTNYDFNGTSRNTSPMRKETWTYPTSGIVNLVSSDTVTDGTNQIGSTTYVYDETSGAGHAALVTTSVPQHAAAGQRGNLTTANQSFSSGGSLTTASAYEDTGNPVSTMAPSGVSTYAYDPATHAFTITATPPTPSSNVSLPSSATYDTNAGVLLTGVDPNNQTVSYASYDPLMRPTEIDYPDGGKMIAGYGPSYMGWYNYMTGTTHTNTQTSQDSYGRPYWVALQNTPGGNYYWNNYCYDGNGNLQYAAYRFVAANQGNLTCSGAGDSYTYDALGRVLTITRGDHSTKQYAYNGRATQMTDENGVSRIIQVDGLGRPTAVCEISGSTLQGVSPANCGLDRPGTGFLTTYAYATDTGANNALKTTVYQGSQTRVFETDWLGRTTSVTEPESATTTTYSYAYSTGTGLGLTVTRKRGTANQANPANLTTTTTQYDALGRVVSVTYSDGTPTKTFAYDAASTWTEAGQQTYLKGRLSSHYRATGAGGAGSIYGYDQMGRVTLQYSCLPSGCGNATYDRKVAYTYNTAGMLTSEGDGAGDTYSYTRSIAGEITGMTDSFSDATDPANIIVPGSVQNGPFGPTTYNLGNGLTAVNTYDTLGRNSGGWVCAGSSQPTCTGGTLQAYGYTVVTVGTQVKGTCDIVVGVCNNFGYDEFNRLTARTVTQGTVQNFTYTFDRYGNRWAQNAPQGGPTLGISFNQANNIISSSGFANDVPGNIASDAIHVYSYDADGNLISVDNGQTARYYYDSLNQRVQVAPSRGTYEFVWDAFGRRVSTWAASNHGFVESNAYTDSAPIAIRAGGSTQFEHQNWLGTERVRTSYNGAVVLSINSLPWADGHTPSGDNGDQHDFARMERDLEDNTEHAQFRQYSTNLGRWQSPDLYLGSYDFTNPQSFNRYTYALNNPTSFVDPSGLDPTCGIDPETGNLECTSYYPVNPDPCGWDPSFCGGGWVCQEYGCGATGGGNSGGGSGGSGPYYGPPHLATLSAPNNGTPWYKNPCLQSALAKGAASTALDALGTLPEGGTIAAAFSLFHGAAGVSNGNNILGRVAFAGGFLSTVGAAHDLQGPQDSALSTTITGLQATAGGAGVAKGFIEDIPVAGQVFAAVSVGLDLLGTGVEVYNCHP